MAHYAEIINDIVQRVIVIDNSWDAVETGLFLRSLSENKWIQTSYNGKIRGRFASVGDYYDVEKDVFRTLQEKTLVDMPGTEGACKWNKEKGTWDVLR